MLKPNEWQAEDLRQLAKSGRNPFESNGMYYATLDGGCAKSFVAIEKLFHDDPTLSNLVCMWCSTHGLHLLLAAIADIDGVKSILDDVKFAITFVRSHGKPTAILKQLSPRKGLVKWAETRMGSEFIVMERVDDLEEQLRQMVDSDSWRECAGGTNIADTKVREKVAQALLQHKCCCSTSTAVAQAPP